MKETLELRVKYEYAHLLFNDNEGKNLGTSIRMVHIAKDDPRYLLIPIISQQLREEGKYFFYGWEIKRKYSPVEFGGAELFKIMVKTTFEPAGEECGTVYDETVACEICGSNRKQIGPLKLQFSSIPKKKDIARTIAGEIVVSEKLVQAYQKRELKGAIFDPVFFRKGNTGYYHFSSFAELELSEKTIGGLDPFDLSTIQDGKFYKCPYGHTIGLNLISETYILSNPYLKNNDFFVSKQLVGIRQGLLMPNPIYLCSPAFRKMVIEEELTGFDFEVAHIES